MVQGRECPEPNEAGRRFVVERGRELLGEERGGAKPFFLFLFLVRVSRVACVCVFSRAVVFVGGRNIQNALYISVRARGLRSVRWDRCFEHLPQP